MLLGVLPEAEDYLIKWPDLNAPSDKDKADTANTLTEALAKYVAGGVDSLMGPKQYLSLILGLELEEIEAIEKATEDWVLERREEEPDASTQN